MIPALCIITLLAFCTILVLSRSILRKYDPRRQPVGIPAALLSLWLVAVAVWGRYYYEIRIAGLMDFTIDRLLLLLVVLIIVASLYAGKISFRRHAAMEYLMLAFSLICLTSMLVHGFLPVLPEFPSPWNNFINGYLFPFVAFVFAKYCVENERDLHLVFQCVFFLGTYLAVISFFEFFNLHQFVFPRYINNPEILIHIDRARGPFLNAAFNGAAITFGFICGAHLLAERKGFARLLYGGMLSLSFPAIFFTQTRSAYLGFLLALALLAAFYRTSFPKWKTFALPLALFAIFLLANIPRMASQERKSGGVMQTEEIEIRTDLIRRSMSMMAISPFSGIGLAQFLPVSSETFPGEAIASGFKELQHFHILGMIVELGVFGSGVYLALVILVFRRLYRLKSVLPPAGFVSQNLLLTLAGIWLVYLATNLFLEPAYCLYFNAVPFVCAGFADGLHGRSV